MPSPLTTEERRTVSDFQEKLESFYSDFGSGKTMVLSTSADGIVSSRMMSVVLIDGKFFFQTDKELRKYSQLKNNKNVALCIDNIQIEGVSEEIGHPLKNTDFCDAFMACFKGSYDAYTSLDNERLFSVDPLFIERWVYADGKPFVETFDITKGEYCFKEYKGI